MFPGVFKDSQTDLSRLRWALMGTSDFALNFLGEGIRGAPNSQLMAIISRDPERGRAAAARLQAPHFFESIETIDRQVVDGVVLCLPNWLHAPCSIAAARRGLHVLVEKPMAPSVAECRAMIEAAQTHGVVLAVAHCMEFASPVAQARKLVAEGLIGEVISASICASYTAPPTRRGWRQESSREEGGGILYDMGVHAVDTLAQIVGPITEVTALIDRKSAHFKTEDLASLLVRFQNRAHGLVQATFNCDQNFFDIHGTKGLLRSNGWLGRRFSGHLQAHLNSGTLDLTTEMTDVYVRQMTHVSDCILQGRSPVISAERGMTNIAVLEAAFDSAQTGRLTHVESC